MIAKLATVEAALAVLIVAAERSLDGTAERIVLWAAAAAALLWFWATVLRPALKILARTARAVEAFEGLPEWDRRLTAVELRVAHTETASYAILRELGIEGRVRRLDVNNGDPPSTP